MTLENNTINEPTATDENGLAILVRPHGFTEVDLHNEDQESNQTDLNAFESGHNTHTNIEDL